MKKFLILVLIILMLLTVGCLDNYVPIEEYNSKVLELEEVESDIISKDIEIAELQKETGNLEDKLDLSKEETEKYQNLIANLNDLLENVYYVYGEGGGTWIGSTGFALEYKNKFYLITAGHSVDGKWGIHKNLRFKANFTDKWVFPKLLTYEVTETIPDYAIFYSDKINNGLEYDVNNTEPDYRLGINKLIQENNNWGIDGECGSPIIDLDGEVIGIYVGYLQDIDLVIEAIDNLE